MVTGKGGRRVDAHVVKKLLLYSCMWCFVAAYGENAADGDALPRVTIAVVRDGPGSYCDELVGRIKQELQILTAGEFDVSFKEIPAFDAGWKVRRVSGVLKAALEDPESSVVLVMGVLVAQNAGRQFGNLPKPVLCGFVMDADTLELQYDEAGHSTVSNFSFVVTPLRASHDLQALHDLVPAPVTHVLIDAKLSEGIRNLESAAARFEERLKFSLEFVPMNESAEEALAALPADAVAVYFTPPLRMSDDEQQKLIDGLNARKVRSLSMRGRPDVERGMLAGLVADIAPRTARRVALNLQQILLGEPAESLSVHLPVDEQLLLNARTAVSIGYVPAFETLIEAEVLFGDALELGENLTLEDAMLRAGAQHVDVEIGLAGAVAAAADRRRTRAGFLPQVMARGQAYRIDDDRAANSGGFQPEARSTAGVVLQQVIFSDSVISRYRQSSFGAEGARFEAESARLDAMAEGGTRFLQYLSAKALYDIEIENLKLTRNNLDLARVRREVGTSGPEELLRLEAQEAQQRSAVLEAEASAWQAAQALNQAMGENLTRRWRPRDIAMKDEDFHFLGGGLRGLVNDARALDALRDYSVQEAEANSPTLRALDCAIRSQEIALRAVRRRGWIPELSASATLDHVTDERFAGPGLGEQLAGAGYPLPPSSGVDDEEWTVAVLAELPLFEGGGRMAEVARASAELREQKAAREKARQLVELQARNALYSLQHAQPNIRLSRIAADRAQKNLDVVMEKYANGSRPLIDLLDAQSQALVQKQTAAIAVHEYLRHLVAYQQAIAWFEVDHTEAEKADWLKRFQGFVASRGVAP